MRTDGTEDRSERCRQRFTCKRSSDSGGTLNSFHQRHKKRNLEKGLACRPLQKLPAIIEFKKLEKNNTRPRPAAGRHAPRAARAAAAATGINQRLVFISAYNRLDIGRNAIESDLVRFESGPLIGSGKKLVNNAAAALV
ncbi:hypothetical protein EVAR_60850_1 [Eumeta japonica]|uniref:Uncharacterized protein n=1 Tax=Eumeta variegata TaxID=151549 RepID=A0A4C1Y8P6_EUMVA|nr:hypothetical protein EVAR_60850_1 [Eumeta japonica]